MKEESPRQESVGEDGMSSGHWFGSLLCVAFSALTGKNSAPQKHNSTNPLSFSKGTNGNPVSQGFHVKRPLNGSNGVSSMNGSWLSMLLCRNRTSGV